MATARKNPKADAPTATFVVLHSIKHDGEDYEPGDEIELTEAQATPLAGSFVQAKAAKGS